MKTTLFYCIVLLLSIGLIRCTTIYEPEGPMLVEGPQGPKGEEGPVGPAGADGSIIHAGQGTPDEGHGLPGDFYLDLTNGNLYGPQNEDGGWGPPISLQGSEGLQGPAGEDGQDGTDGQDGADGQDGSQIFAGDGVPPDGLGSEGDYYLDINSYYLYGPKTGTGWGNSVNLQGPQGPPGEQGPQGSPGTANVLYSDWMDIEWNGRNDPTFKRMDIEEPLVLEEDFIDNGTLMVYVKEEVIGIGVLISPLPYIVGNTSLFFAIIDADDGTTVVRGISVISTSLDNNPADELEGYQVRYVLIPGGTYVNLKGRIDLENYTEVARAFNLKN